MAEKQMNLFEGMDLPAEKVSQLTEAFDKAVVAKSVTMLDEHVEKMVAEKEEILKEAYDEKIENLESTLSGYMDSVVEEFVAENAPSYQAQITDEKAKKLLEMFDTMVTLTGVDMLKIQEAKSIDDESGIEYKVQKLEEKVADQQDDLIEARSEADKFLKSGLIAEMKADLTLVEGEKFEKLAEMVTFGRNEKYSQALDTIVESIKDNREDSFNESEVNLPKNAFVKKEIDIKSVMDHSQYV